MKKTAKKIAAKASHKKALKNLDVTPARGGSVRGGGTLFQKCATGEHFPKAKLL